MVISISREKLLEEWKEVQSMTPGGANVDGWILLLQLSNRTISKIKYDLPDAVMQTS